MTEFVEQDLSGARFERMSLRNASFKQVYLNDATMEKVDFSGVDIRGALLRGTRMTGVELSDVEISGDLHNVVVNGVDIAPLVEQELNRREPDRAKMRPETVAGFKEAWAIIRRLWDATIENAKTLPSEALHTSVNGEWSFIQTLRHLNFASAAWIDRMLVGNLSPWHPLDLPWDEAPGWDGIPWDRDARPTLDEVLNVRHERQATMSRVIDSLTEEQLASVVSRTEPGWPQIQDFAFKNCLIIVLTEEWEHRGFAERDLAKLNGKGL
ncbi:MAG: DinB family protein [Actinomycetia bacterium]|nr:DinB family protein [Actinomycetes bacterium]